MTTLDFDDDRNRAQLLQGKGADRLGWKPGDIEVVDKEQMCCRGGHTAAEHRGQTSDGRCCTDVPPTVDGYPDAVTAHLPGQHDQADLGGPAKLNPGARVWKPGMTSPSFIQKQEPQRYALGVVYAAKELDAEKDYATSEELEQAAWDYLRNSRSIGVMHKDGTTGKGELVESYIYRGPPWRVGDQVVEEGDWVAGAIFEPETFERIKNGDLTGWSLEGEAQMDEENSIVAHLPGQHDQKDHAGDGGSGELHAKASYAHEKASPRAQYASLTLSSASFNQRISSLEAAALREEAQSLTAHLPGQHDQQDHAGDGD